MARKLARIITPFFVAHVAYDAEDRCIREVAFNRTDQPIVGWNLDLLMNTLTRATDAAFNGQHGGTYLEEVRRGRVR